MRQPSYPILTDRLLIRPYTRSDFEALYALQSREDVARYLYWRPRTRREVQDALAQRLRTPTLDDDGEVLVLAAELRESGAYVGDLSLFVVSVDDRQGEIGFVFHPDHQGLGLGREAAEVLLWLGFDHWGFHRIVGRCDGRNHASAKLMTRLGMRQEAHLVENERVKGEWTEELVFAMLESEWRRRVSGPSE
ncbi:MAG: GNAT family N-acetyltransferase [Propionibacteriales bacterium]|nr:GNAT family N-acetyltransferase [Propionibacteriales bacterium]